MCLRIKLVPLKNAFMSYFAILFLKLLKHFNDINCLDGTTQQLNVFYLLYLMTQLTAHII
jgi:hypothetical protein